jgi:small-conductance mechanosensitive channel
MNPKDQTVGSEQERIQAFLRKDKVFLESIKQEYCFYDSRYKYALRQLIGKLQAGYSESNSENQALIKKYLQASQTLNRKLNDLTQLTNTITQTRLQQTQDQSSAMNSLNAQLEERSKLLQKQNRILATEQGAANLYKDMTRYTKEKVDSTNNLLTLYSFLNITALGLIFYLYAAMKE